MTVNVIPGRDPGSTFLCSGWKKRGIPAFAGMTMGGPRRPLPIAAVAAPDYSKASSWLCLPFALTYCSTPVPTDRAQPQRLRLGRAQRSRQDPADRCSTLSDGVRDAGLNSDSAPAARALPRKPFARFASVCGRSRHLRQMTLAAVAQRPLARRQPQRLARLRRRAGRLANYLRQNQSAFGSRPQPGTSCSSTDRRESRPPGGRAADELRSSPATMCVPQGILVAGHVHETRSAAGRETGCVMTWVSFRERELPPR